MTGGQLAPSSETNLAGEPNKFSLRRAIEAEGGRTVVVDSFDMKEVTAVLKEALKLAEQGIYTTLILEGACIHETENKDKIRTICFDEEICVKCGRCSICPGIETNDDDLPHYTNLCANCGSNKQVCFQRCNVGAIVPIDSTIKLKSELPELLKAEDIRVDPIKKELLPESLRLAIRGIGGQGNLFFGKVLSEMALLTPYSDTYIVKGDTHGMAQLGGSVISTFSCGNVYSPILAPGSADLLVVMEVCEMLRPGFLDLLKPGGTLIINDFKILPPTAKKEDYPDIEKIYTLVKDYKVIIIDANKVVYSLGDKAGKTANVAILGLLSTIKPFNFLPEGIWLQALMSVSPNDFIKSANKLAFDAGRKYKM